MFRTRTLKALIASLAVVIALLVAAVPASARQNGQGKGSQSKTVTQTYSCEALGFANGCFMISLT